jgi:hypothetical protein
MTQALSTRTSGLFASVSRAWKRILHHSREPSAPPPAVEAGERAAWGAAQPILASRILLRDHCLLVEALVPAAWLAAACGLYATLQNENAFWEAFYQAFMVMAPVPSVIFANHFARLAAMVRWRLGFGACGPREYPIAKHAARALGQSLLVAGGILPFAALALLVPGIGEPIFHGVMALWALQWVVTDALDAGRVLRPGETVRDVERRAETTKRPWFVRAFRRLGEKLPGPLGWPAKMFASMVDRVSRVWREEIALLEAQPALAAGFGAGAAVLMAIPFLNLFFRPILVVAATHLLGHIEAEEARLTQEPPPVAVALDDADHPLPPLYVR